MQTQSGLLKVHRTILNPAMAFKSRSTEQQLRIENVPLVANESMTIPEPKIEKVLDSNIARNYASQKGIVYREIASDLD